MEIFEFVALTLDFAPRGYAWCLGEIGTHSPVSIDRANVVLMDYKTITMKLLVPWDEVERIMKGGVPLITQYTEVKSLDSDESTV